MKIQDDNGMDIYVGDKVIYTSYHGKTDIGIVEHDLYFRGDMKINGLSICYILENYHDVKVI